MKKKTALTGASSKIDCSYLHHLSHLTTMYHLLDKPVSAASAERKSMRHNLKKTKCLSSCDPVL